MPIRRLAIFSFAFAAGTFLCAYLLPEGLLWLLAVGAGLPALVLLPVRGRLHVRRAAIALLAVALAAVRFMLFLGVEVAGAEKLCAEDREQTFTVAGYGEQTAYGLRVRAELRGVGTMLYLHDTPLLAPGDTVTAPASVRLSTGADGDNTYFRAKGILLTAFVRDDVRVTKAGAVPLRFWPAVAANAVGERVDRCFPAGAAGLMRAMLLGDRSGLSEGAYDDLKDAGLAHVTAVSGLHISFLVTALGFLRLNRRRTAAITIPLLVFYMFMTGATPSVTRAVFLAVVMLVAPLFRRESDRATTLGLALLVTLLINPCAIQSVSLQLSYAAVIGIYAFSGRLGRFLLDLFRVRRQRSALRRILRGAAGSIDLSLCASVFTVPLTAVYFGSVPLLAPVSNLLVFWVVAFLFPLGLAAAVIGLVLPGVGSVLGAVLSVPCAYILLVARLIAQVPFARLVTGSVPAMAWLLCAYAVFFTVALTRGWRRRWAVPVLCLTGGFVLASLGNALYQSSVPLRVAVLDVGQGESVVVTAGGETLIVDSGGDRYGGEDVVEQYLLSLGQSSARALVVTHFHEDHALYVPSVLRRVRTETLYAPESAEEGETEAVALAAAAANGTAVSRVREVTSFPLGEATVTLFPPLGDTDGNDACVACLVTLGDFDVLITGDMPAAGERMLLTNYGLPDLEMLVGGHHGSETSTGEMLLDLGRPETAVISVGADNSYGHPAPETLARLAARDIAFWRTDENGTVVITVYPED